VRYARRLDRFNLDTFRRGLEVVQPAGGDKYARRLLFGDRGARAPHSHVIPAPSRNTVRVIPIQV
jgi:hypothetical protein